MTSTGAGSRPKGTLAAQLQPRLVVTVAVMAILVSLTTVLAARTILFNQLDSELDAAQVRQTRGTTKPGDDRVPGIETPGMRAGTVIALQLSDGRSLGTVVKDYEFETVTAPVQLALISLPADGVKRTITLEGMGEYRVEARETRLGKVSVGLPVHDINRMLLWLSLFAGAVSLVAIGATAMVTREVLGRATKPLEALTDTADNVSSLDLERGAVEVPRVDVAQLPDSNEVSRLAMAFNQMLGRVEGALTAREESELKLRRFVADASHELRNPLAAIRGYAELTQRAPDGTDTSFALSRIESESQRMTKLVNDLLLLARLDSDPHVDLTPVDVVEVVLNAVSDAQAASHDHTWVLDLPETEIRVLADADQLHQVMINLLANARTHTPPGTTVRTRVRTEGPFAVIELSDNGPGIPPEVLPRVFERFARADDSRAHSVAQSTGLGLAIVRAVVESFSGTASVASVPGETTFTVRLPLATDPGM